MEKRGAEDGSDAFDGSSTKRLRQEEEEEEEEEEETKCYAENGRRILRAIDGMTTNDEVHKSIKFEPVCKAFIDTPHFQRLRFLKQLATAELVYVCAGHTRLEHSHGVAHLASKVAKNIKEAQPQLKCSDKDILCIKLAGLLHDLGHGAFSHVYERFIHKQFPKHFETLSDDIKALYNEFEEVPKDYGHEEVSLMLIDSALAHLGLEINLHALDEPLKEIGDVGIQANSFRSFGLDQEVLTSRDLVFCKECIWGKPIPSICQETGIKGFVGRPDWEYEWMYDIVANRHSGCDVDKVDYFCRDSRRCFGEGQVDEVMIRDPVVAWGQCTVEGGCELCSGDRPHPGKHLMLCYPKKRVAAAIEFFNTRFKLHKMVYWHKAIVAASMMVMDIFCLADPFYRISTTPKTNAPGRRKSDVRSLPLSRVMLDDQAYIRLRDSVIEAISNTSDERLEQARRLADRYIDRDLYKCAGERSIDDQNPNDLRLWDMSEREILQGLIGVRGIHKTKKGTVTLSAEDIIVDKFTMHHGQKERNPIENIRVVGSSSWSRLAEEAANLPIAEPVEIGKYKAQTPIVQEEKCIRVFCRGNAEKRELLGHVFTEFPDRVLQTAESPAHPISQAATPSGQGENDQFLGPGDGAPMLDGLDVEGHYVSPPKSAKRNLQM